MPSQGRLGDKSYAPADGHGCIACAHPVIGPAIKGSSDVFVNSLPALRVGDNGVHAACCGPNTWTAVKGSSTVFINGRPAHRMGDQDMHCGGMGQLVEGSSNVMVGDSGAGGGAAGAGAGDADLIAYDPSAVSGEAISALACTQAQTLREAAKSGVPFCEKCTEADALASEAPESNIYSDSDELADVAVSNENIVKAAWDRRRCYHGEDVRMLVTCQEGTREGSIIEVSIYESDVNDPDDVAKRKITGTVKGLECEISYKADWLDMYEAEGDEYEFYFTAVLKGGDSKPAKSKLLYVDLPRFIFI